MVQQIFQHTAWRRCTLASGLALAASMCVPTAATAQPTSTSLGSYTLCRTTAQGQGCHEVSMVTAARFDGNGVRNGTTGTISLRNLQGGSFVAPNGSSYATGTGASVLTGITLYTQGCLPGQSCVSPFFFDGLDFGTSQSGAAAISTTGPVGGTVPAWTWAAEKPLAANNPNILRFDAPTVYVGPGSNNQRLGIGGCTAGGGQAAGQFFDVVQATSTCAAQGQTGAVQFSFATGYIFDPTYFGSMRVDWAQQTTPGQGAYAPYFCSVGASVLGQAMTQAQGGCVAFTSITAVPEPGTWASLGAGLVAVAALVRRRRQTA